MIINLISVALACNLPMKSLKIYPTVGELFAMPLQQLFYVDNPEYSCRFDCPKNVTILNGMNPIEIYPLYYTTKALSSNKTHFVTLTYEQTVILHIFDYNTNLMTSLPPVQIDPPLHCFNSLFTPKQQIILDCYNYKQQLLLFYYLNKSTLIIMQTFQNQNKPYKTKLLNFIQNKQIYILYAQFFSDYELLTLFLYGENQLINQSTRGFKQALIDFDVSLSYLYLLDQSYILQVYLNAQTQFEISAQYSRLQTTSMKVIKVKNFYFSSSQCDILYVGSESDLIPLMKFLAWNGSIVLFESSYNPALDMKKNPQIQIQFSEQFVICQFNNDFTLNYIGDSNFGQGYSFFNTTDYLQIKFSYLEGGNNYLFQFSDQIEIYSLQIPQLQVYSNDFNLNKFFIYMTSVGILDMSCQLEITPILIDKADKNIYVTYNKTDIFYTSMQNTSFVYPLTTLSGPLMKAIGNVKEIRLGTLRDTTFQQQDARFNQQFRLTNLFQIPYANKIFFVGATIYDEIYFFLCEQDWKCTILYNDANQSLITKIAISFRFANTLIVGVDQGNSILIYNVDVFQNYTINVTKVHYEFSNYKQFLLSYDNIILLLNDEIQIQSLIDQTILSINKQTISDAFKINQIPFNPVNIEMNEAYLSSILYINNVDSVIIVAIQNTKSIIPFSIIKVNQIIYQLNIMNYQLIISYFCDQLLCFQVWNVQNLLKPILVKTLPSLLMQRNWNIISDNIFLYILSQNITIIAINPLLSYHSQLYYQFDFEGEYFTSISKGSFSIISFNNTIYKLNAIMKQQFETQQTFMNIYLDQTQFNFNVTNDYQQSIQTQSQILTIINDLTTIFIEGHLNQSFVTGKQYIISLTTNSELKLRGQITSFSISNENFCKLHNYIENQTNIAYQTNDSVNSQLLILNQTLVIQKGSYIWNLNVQQNQGQNNIKINQSHSSYQVYSDNFTFCGKTTFYNFSIVTQICFTPNAIFPISLSQFKFDCLLENCTYSQIISTKITRKFTHIEKMMTLNQQNHIILANSKVYLLKLDIEKQLVHCQNLRIPCDQGIKDFILLELTEIPNYYIILYICQTQLLYRVGYINQDDEFVFQKGTFSNLLITAEKLIQLGDGKIGEVLLLSQKYFSFLLMLTTNNAVNIIFFASYEFSNNENDEFLNIILQPQQIVSTIPPYGNYRLIQATVVKWLIFLVFESDFQKLYAVYDWLEMGNNISTPLLMKGGISDNNSKLTSLAFNITSSSQGYVYIINDSGYISAYIINGDAYLNCSFNDHKDKQLFLTASNSFSQGFTTIDFKQIQQQRWFIGLMSFVGAFFSIAIFIYWYKTRNIQNTDNSVEESLGLEL